MESLKRKHFQRKFKTLIAQIDTSSALKAHFFSVFLVRRTFFSIVLVVLNNAPYVQWGGILFQQALVSVAS